MGRVLADREASTRYSRVGTGRIPVRGKSAAVLFYSTTYGKPGLVKEL